MEVRLVLRQILLGLAQFLLQIGLELLVRAVRLGVLKRAGQACRLVVLTVGLCLGQLMLNFTEFAFAALHGRAVGGGKYGRGNQAEQHNE